MVVGTQNFASTWLLKEKMPNSRAEICDLDHTVPGSVMAVTREVYHTFGNQPSIRPRTP